MIDRDRFDHLGCAIVCEAAPEAGSVTPTLSSSSAATALDKTTTAARDGTFAPPKSSLWVRGGGIGYALTSSESETASPGHGDAVGGWSSEEADKEEGSGSRRGEGEVGDQGAEEGIGSDMSWGSCSGEYRARGQGKLVSDAEFFEYFGSLERDR